MAVTAKAFKSNYAQNYMLDILTSTGNDYDTIRGNLWGSVTHASGISKIYADNATQTSGNNYTTDFDGIASLTWGSVSGGSVSITNTPVLSVDAGTTINYLGLIQENTGGSEWRALIEFTISAEEFTYAGTITITSLTLEISNTIGTPA